jgi:hypothetical protein
MRLLRIPEPFDHPDFVFEPKLDGFRALAQIEGNRCSVISRNGNVFKSWRQLCEELAHAVRCDSAVIDGEICCLEPDGRTNFYDLLFRREEPYFYAFDLLMLNGEDLRALPLTERKRRLAAIMLKAECRVLFLDSIAEREGDLPQGQTPVGGLAGRETGGTKPLPFCHQRVLDARESIDGARVRRDVSGAIGRRRVVGR